MNSALPQQINNLLREGVVVEVDHGAWRCRVQSGEIVTDYIPWLAGAAGAFSVWAPPSEGEQVHLLCVDGDLSNAVVLRGMFSAQFPAPSAQADLVLLQFKDGARIAYDFAAHALQAQLPTGGTVSIIANGGVSIEGPVTIKGDAKITGTVSVSGKVTANEDVVGGGVSLKQHTHGGVQSGGAKSGPPA